MSYEPFDSPDAPPLGDVDAPRPGVPSPDATAICISLDRMTAAINRLADARPVAPGAPQAPASTVPPPAATPPPGGSNETQVKRGKKIYAVCMGQNRDVKEIGEHVVGHQLNGNSQKWSEADQVAVLDAFKEWGWG